MDATTTAYPADDPKAVAAQEAFEETLRDWMRMWRDRGVVLEPDSPLRRFWPADEPRR